MKWLLFLASSLTMVRMSKSDENLVRLYRTILHDYENNVRPSIRHDMPVNVTFSFSLTQLIDVDERKEIITTNAWIRQAWRDYRLIWHPLEYNNLTKIHLPHEKIWKPDIILYNNAASEYLKSVMSTDVVVSFDGNVSWTMAGIFQSSCGMDVRYYPFDQQKCILKFASWAYDGTKIDILLSSSLGDQSNYMISTEWNLRKIRAEKNSIIYSCCPEPYPFIDIFITIQRRPMFYVFNLILPCVMITGISLLGFFMPSGAGEKVSLGITSLLSTTVFLMLVAEGMPPTSDALPLLGIYYGATIFIVSLATAMTVFTLNIHHSGTNGKPVPVIVQRIFFGYIAKGMFMHTGFYHSINEHVEYFYTKEHGTVEGEEDRTHLRWMSKKFEFPAPENATPTLNRLSQRTSAPNVSPLAKERDHSVVTKRVSFTNELLTPNGTSRNGGGNLGASVKLSNRRNHISAIVETTDKSPIDETIFGGTSTPKKKSANIASPDPSGSSVDSDIFENEFLRVLSKVHAALERNEMRLAEKDRRNATRQQWHQIALVLDRFLFILFASGTLLTSLGIIYQRQLSQFLGF